MNPIKNSDLYVDDGQLKKLLADLQAIEKQYVDMVNTIKGQAAKLEVSITSTTTATEAGREQTKKAATETDELEKRLEKYNQALADNRVKIEAVNNAIKQTNQLNRLEAKLLAAKEGSYNALSAQLGLNLQALKQLSKAERENTEEGKELIKQTKKIREELKELDKQTGQYTRNVGHYSSALEGLGGPFGNWIGNLKKTRTALKDSVQGLSATVKGFKSLRVAIIATGIGALIVLLATLTNAFLKTQKGMDFMERGLAVISSTMNVLIERGAKLFDVVVNIFNRPIAESWEKAGEAISGVTDDIIEQGKKADELTVITQNLARERNKLTTETKKAREEQKRLNLIVEDNTKSQKERNKAALEVAEIERNIRQKNESLLLRELDVLEQKNKLANTLFEDEQALERKKQEIAEFKENSLERETTNNNKLNQIVKDGISQANELKQKEQERKEAIQDLTTEIENSQAKLGGAAEVARLEYDRAIAKIQELKAEAKTLGADLDFSSLELIEESKLVRALDGILGDTGALKPKLNELGKIAGLNFKSGLGESLSQPLPANLGQNAIAQTKKIKEDLEKDLFKSDVIENGIFSAIGFELGIGEKAQQDIKAFYDFALSEAINFAKHRQQLAQQNIEAAQAEVSEAETALQREIDARNAGFAHNTATAAKELAAAKQREREQIAAAKKAQREQIALETLQQTSSLVTAAAKIWAKVGFPAAIPAIATMFGSFALSKVRAFQLVKNKKEFAQGGYEELNYGGSHASGSDIPLGHMADGTERRVERGEGLAIFAKKRVRQYGGIIPQIVKAINSGQLESVLNINANAARDIPLFAPTVNFNNDAIITELKALRAQGKNFDNRDANGRGIVRKGNVTTRYI